MNRSSRSARMTSIRTNRLLSHPQKNTERCDDLRRRIQMHTFPSLIEALAEECEVSICSIYNQIEGRQKLSVDLIVALLANVPSEETETSLNRCLAHTKFRLVRLPSVQASSTSLLVSAADASVGAGSVVSAAALAIDDGKVDVREADDLDERATAAAARLVLVGKQARGMVS